MVATTASYQRWLGQGTGPILLNIVGCTGTESSLLNCSHRDLDYYYFYYFPPHYYLDCSYNVGVVCPSCKSCFNMKVVTSDLLSELNMLGVSNCGYYGPHFCWMASDSSMSHQIKNVLHPHSSVYTWHYEIAIPNMCEKDIVVHITDIHICMLERC